MITVNKQWEQPEDKVAAWLGGVSWVALRRELFMYEYTKLREC